MSCHGRIYGRIDYSLRSHHLLMMMVMRFVETIHDHLLEGRETRLYPTHDVYRRREDSSGSCVITKRTIRETRRRLSSLRLRSYSGVTVTASFSCVSYRHSVYTMSTTLLMNHPTSSFLFHLLCLKEQVHWMNLKH